MQWHMPVVSGSGRVVHGIEPHANNVRGLQSTPLTCTAVRARSNCCAGRMAVAAQRAPWSTTSCASAEPPDVRTSLVLLVSLTVLQFTASNIKHNKSKVYIYMTHHA